MGNIMLDAERLLNDTLLAIAAEEVVYSACDGASFNCRAIIGKTLFRVDGPDGIVTRINATDFMVPASDMAKLGRQPVKGDMFYWHGLAYEVYAPDNELCWRYSGDGRELYRIHAIEVNAGEDMVP